MKDCEIVMMRSLFVAIATMTALPGVLGDFKTGCATAYAGALSSASAKCAALRTQVESGAIVADLGSRCDEICNEALEAFSSKAPSPEGDSAKEAHFDERVETLNARVERQLKATFLKQLNLLRSRNLRNFAEGAEKKGGNSGAEREAYVQALREFKDSAEASVRPGADWDYAQDLQSLQEAIGEIYKRTKKTEDLKAQASQQQQAALTFLRMQQQQIQAYQNQASVGGATGWHANLAYRIPESPINLLATMRPGMKTTLSVFAPPEHAFPVLGQNHFVEGLTALNLGLSANVEF